MDRTAVGFKSPSEIKGVRNAAGTNESAVLFGDPSKPGPYVVRVKWFPGNMSRPHFHPNDRFFAVLSGTWWMGTGEVFDPESTVPAPAGSYVIHYAGKVHYDGAKHEETIIQVWGMGPATSTPAEKRCRGGPASLRPVTLLQHDPVALGEAIERPPVDAEELGGALLVPARLLEHAADVARDDAAEAQGRRRGRPAARGDHRLNALGRQIFGLEHRVRGQGDGPLDGVLELADVAGPVVGGQ